VYVYSFVVTAVLLKATGVLAPLRVAHEEEETGLDLTQHGELGYTL
jgi:Amt family ammonium transporter